VFLSPDSGLRKGGYVPVAISRLLLDRRLPEQVWARVTHRPQDSGAVLVDLRVTDEQGRIVADFEGVEFRAFGSPTAASGPAEPAADDAPQQGGRSREELLDLLVPLSEEGRRRTLTGWLADEVKDTLGGSAGGLDFDLDGIDPSLALLELGLDSLMATELQRRLQQKLDFHFKAMQGIDYQSIDYLVDFLLEQVLAVELDERSVERSAA
jgi:acyl carrier protein